MAHELVVPQEEMAILIVTLDGEQGELPDLIPYNTSDEDVRRLAAEAVAGGLQGIPAQRVDFSDFVIKPLPARDGLPNRIQIRPGTPFGQ